MPVVLIQPPLCDPSRPYPAIAYLAGYLRTLGREAALEDASLALVLRMFSREGIAEIADAARASADPRVRRFVARAAQYADTIETAVACVQGHDVSATLLAARPGYFPPPLHDTTEWAFAAYYATQRYTRAVGALTPTQRAHIADTADLVGAAFGPLGHTDRARFVASNVISDVATVIREAIDPGFEIDAYASSISDDPATFAPIAARLAAPATLIDRHIDAIADDIAERHDARLFGFSLPFAGNVIGALRMAARIRARRPGATIVFGGGWVNTQLRGLTDPAIFDYAHYITVDDGERPLQALIELTEGRRPAHALTRTFTRIDGAVRYIDADPQPVVAFADVGTPTYGTLPLRRYLGLRASLQSCPPLPPARWNALTLAHGCYWKRCAFCDTHLDYIGRYDPATVDILIKRIRQLIDETGDTAFHFVDEAMPPALLGRLAERLVAERLQITWWGNARFDRALIPLAPVLAQSGCVAITGGLEVPVARLLDRMRKGVSLEQAAQVCHAMASRGILTHAYLIYGFPTETAQETIDGLEFVRQMFAQGCLHSGFWHDFTLTAHSPIAAAPADFGITLRSESPRPFSRYMLSFDEPGRIDHTVFKAGLTRAVQHYTLQLAIDDPLDRWFDRPVPRPSIPPDLVASFLRDR